MNLVYAIINFAILAIGLYLVGRKMVARMFTQRRRKIEDGLQKAEEGRRAAAESLETIAQLRTESEKRLSQQKEAARQQRREQQRAMEEENREAIERLEQESQRELDALRLEMLQQVRGEIVHRTVEQARKTLMNPSFAQGFRVWEKDLADKLLQHARLTPGNRVALRRDGQLPAGVVSAFALRDEEQARLRTAMESLVPSGEGELLWSVKTEPALVGGLQLFVGDVIYDGSIDGMLRLLEDRLGREAVTTEMDVDAMAESIRQGIEALPNEIDIRQWGRVLSVSDGICWTDGLADAMYGELVEFENGERGMVLSVEAKRVAAVIFGPYEAIQEKSSVRRLGRTADVPVGEALLGRVVNALGQPMDGRGAIRTETFGPVENPAPAILERKSVSVPLETGIKAVDALVPIGRGQRELIIGDRQTGKTALALDAILNQRGKHVLCIYVAVGQKETSVARVVNMLRQNGAMDYTVVVCADASQPSPLRYLAPYAGAAMGEYFMRQGKDVLIVYDDLSKHADAYREISLLLQRPSGREAYPGDVFYLHSRLLERAARLSEEAGGGSMTALPIVETQAGDISAYIPTNVISITDGQIYLEGDQFREGQRPAVNVGLSVSRVGGAAQIGAMRQVAGKLRMELAQYRELAAFSQFGSDLDESTQRTLARGQRMTMALRQGQYEPMPMAEQVMVIYAVSNGYADAIPAKEIPAFEHALREHFRAHHRELLDRIASGGKMSPELLGELNAALTAFKERDGL